MTHSISTEPSSPQGDEERSDEATTGEDVSPPNPEVLAKPVRRRFTADFKLRILDETDNAGPGEIGRILRREGLFSSQLAVWRKARKKGTLAALSKKRGPRKKAKNPLQKKVDRLERENARLRDDLEKANLILEVQKKVAALLGNPIDPGKLP